MEINKSSGQASRLLLVLAVIVLVAAIIVYLIVRMAEKPPAPPAPPRPLVVLPVYETILGDIKFVYISAIDRGNDLKVSQTQTASMLQPCSQTSQPRKSSSRLLSARTGNNRGGQAGARHGRAGFRLWHRSAHFGIAAVGTVHHRC